MQKSTAMNILATFAALALSILFLTRTAAPYAGGAGPAAEVAAKTAPAPIVITSYPADAVIIEAQPPK